MVLHNLLTVLSQFQEKNGGTTFNQLEYSAHRKIVVGFDYCTLRNNYLQSLGDIWWKE